MPPWHAAHGYGEFVGERRLTDAQIATHRRLGQAGGMPRGRRRRRCRSCRRFLPMDGSSVSRISCSRCRPASTFPASGPDVFRNFVIPTKLTEDKWVRAIEFRPGARKVVHHALFAQVRRRQPCRAGRRGRTAGIRRDGYRGRGERSRGAPAASVDGPSGRRRGCSRPALRRGSPRDRTFSCRCTFT